VESQDLPSMRCTRGLRRDRERADGADVGRETPQAYLTTWVSVLSRLAPSKRRSVT